MKIPFLISYSPKTTLLCPLPLRGVNVISSGHWGVSGNNVCHFQEVTVKSSCTIQFSSLSFALWIQVAHVEKTEPHNRNRLGPRVTRWRTASLETSACTVDQGINFYGVKSLGFGSFLLGHHSLAFPDQCRKVCLFLTALPKSSKRHFHTRFIDEN